MITDREPAILEIKERIKVNKSTIGITSFKRAPSRQITKGECPCVVLLEGVDAITKHAGRGNTGYPARRVLEVIVELITESDADIRGIYNTLRSKIFTERGSDPEVFNAVVAPNTFINENRTEGPISYGLPDILVMRLVLDLVYTDKGLKED